MLIEDVKKLSTLERFLYLCHERHQIYLRRKAGMEWPWTDDEILQTYYFTNTYRELDKTTVWLRENIREPLAGDNRVLMATIIFRWFNLINTGEILKAHNLFTDWNEKKSVELLKFANIDGPVFTGAFMVKAGNGPPGCKIPMVCECISEVWKEQKSIIDVCKSDCRMEALQNILVQFRGLGDFMAYEIVCDVRFTHLLQDATDVDTWCNVGPGAMRGLARLEGKKPVLNKKGRMSHQGGYKPNEAIAKTRRLLAVMKKRFPRMPKFELREAEMLLCEFSKYENALWGDGGRLKRRYTPHAS